MASHPRMEQIILSLQMSQSLMTRALGAPLTPAQMTFQIVPGGSHIAYLAGHVAFARDMMIVKSLTGKSCAPEGFTEALFNMGVRPAADPAAYPSYDAVKSFLESSLEATIAALEAANPAILDRDLPAGPAAGMFKTFGRLFSLTPLHDAYHAGQITLLRRAQGLDGGMGI